MKRTSLRKNRFSAKRARLPENSPKRKLSGKLRRSRGNARGADGDVGESRMEQLVNNDRDIVALLTDAMSRPISPEAQAFYDRMAALTRGKARTEGDLKPDLSDAA